MNDLKEDNLLNKIFLKHLDNNKISDFHFKSNEALYVRILGDIEKVDDQIYTSKDIVDFLTPIFNDYIKQQFKENKQVDFIAVDTMKNRYRGNLYRIDNGYGLNFRKINQNVLSLETLNAPEIFKKICSLEKGIVLICGATGSGKTTTLNSMINYINENKKKHIITIEDPIEFIHKTKNCLIHQREIGRDANSFSLALKSAMREDPDIILLGEMRDKESIREALTAAETGHLVFGTLHTQSATTSINRIIDVFEAEEKNMIRSMLSMSLQAVVLQKLFKTIDGNGRVCAFEVLLNIPSVRNLIKENKIMQINSIMQTGSQYGMITMENSIEKLFKSGSISRETRDEALLKFEDI